MNYGKPFLTYEQQAELLLERGMVVERDVLINHLRNVGYYRLGGYWFIWKQDDERFISGTTFSRIWRAYTFDRQLRLAVFDGIERIEIYFRTQLAYSLAGATGPFGYEKPANLSRMRSETYERFISKCSDAFKRSREPFALHFKEKYGDIHDLPPYWMLVSLMDFGMILTLFRGAPVAIRNSVASNVGLSSRVLESWLVTLNTVRNICAHHGRLWNRTIGTKPMIPNRKNDIRWHEPYAVGPDKVFCVLTMLSYLLGKIAPQTQWRHRLSELFNSYSDIDKTRMGFEPGWEKCPFWKPWFTSE